MHVATTYTDSNWCFLSLQNSQWTIATACCQLLSQQSNICPRSAPLSGILAVALVALVTLAALPALVTPLEMHFNEILTGFQQRYRN